MFLHLNYSTSYRTALLAAFSLHISTNKMVSATKKVSAAVSYVGLIGDCRTGAALNFLASTNGSDGHCASSPVVISAEECSPGGDDSADRENFVGMLPSAALKPGTALNCDSDPLTPEQIAENEKAFAEEQLARSTEKTEQLRVDAPAEGKDVPGCEGLVWGKMLGKGKSGQVWKVASKKEPSKVYALKKLTCGNEKKDLEAKEAFESEAQILQELIGTGVVEYKGSFGSGGTHCILMELCEGGSLRDMINGRWDDGGYRGFGKEEVLNILGKTAAQLQKMHAENIVHYDLKPENLFLRAKDDSRSVAIGDFGIAGKPGAGDTKLTEKGTLPYMSPEMFKGDVEARGSKDVWALGVILFELLTGEPLFDARKSREAMYQIIQFNFKWLEEKGGKALEDWKELLGGMLQTEPEKRWEAETVADWCLPPQNLKIPCATTGYRLLSRRNSFDPLDSCRSNSRAQQRPISTGSGARRLEIEIPGETPAGYSLLSSRNRSDRASCRSNSSPSLKDSPPGEQEHLLLSPWRMRVPLPPIGNDGRSASGRVRFPVESPQESDWNHRLSASGRGRFRLNSLKFHQHFGLKLTPHTSTSRGAGLIGNRKPTGTNKGSPEGVSLPPLPMSRRG